MFDRNNFIGLNGFVWWVGEIEDRMDPLNMGRVRVRIFAYWSNRDYGRDRDFNTMFMLKNYGETIDLNNIAVFSSDTRFYRYWLANSTIGWYKFILVWFFK